MKLQTIESDAIHKAGYDPESQTLQLHLASGTVRNYEGVSKTLYKKFIAADSKGAFYNANIKGKFPGPA